MGAHRAQRGKRGFFVVHMADQPIAVERLIVDNEALIVRPGEPNAFRKAVGIGDEEVGEQESIPGFLHNEGIRFESDVSDAIGGVAGIIRVGRRIRVEMCDNDGHIRSCVGKVIRQRMNIADGGVEIRVRVDVPLQAEP